MTTAKTQDLVRLDDADRTWQLLAGRVEALVAAWEAAGPDPPALAELVPAGPAGLRRLALVELIKVDLEYRWLHRRTPRRVEEYLADFPELAAGGVPCDLLYEEYHVRKQAGQAPAPAEYFERFPRQAAELGRLLGTEVEHLSTALCRRDRLAAVEVGDRIDDFDLLLLLGQGAFARVFLARQRSLQRLVALKVSAARGPEPQTLAQLDHPHIVRVFDQRTLPDRDLCLLYMQYLPGGTLQGVIEHARLVPPAARTGATLLEAVDRTLHRQGSLAAAPSPRRERLAALAWPEVVCWVGARLAAALDHAHGQGVLHRDLKPANVLLGADGSPLLADFNVSHCTKLEGASAAAFFGGTLAYMSPEQLEAFNPAHPRPPDSLDGRSDLYSLGVLLWELLTGARPFPDEPLAGDWSATLEQMHARRRAGVDARPPGPPWAAPAGLLRTLKMCLAPDPDQRLAPAAELGRQLDLGLQPRARSLLEPPAGGWRRAVLRRPVLAVLLLAALPNLLAGFFNLIYNQEAIVAHLPAAQTTFRGVLLVINGIAFPLGLGILGWLAGRVGRGLRPSGGSRPAGSLSDLRQQALRLGPYAAALSIAAWAVAGVAYPLALSVTGDVLPMADVVHFMVSLVLNGLIAAAYPFFGVTFVAVRVLVPALLDPAAAPARDLASLARLSRLTWLYLLLAAAVPMLAMLALAVLGSANRLALAGLSAAGLAGFGLAFGLFRAIQDDLATLATVVRPPGDPLEGGGSSASSPSWLGRG